MSAEMVAGSRPQNQSEYHEKTQQRYAQGEHRGQQMHQFEALGVLLIEVDAGNAAVENLSEKLAKISTALVPHPRFGEQSAGVAALEDADGEVDVLAEAHFAESAELQIDVAPNAHVERTGVKLVQLFLATTNASRGEEGGHGIRNGLLGIAERRMCTVRSTECVGRSSLQLLFHLIKIIVRHHHITVKNDEILTQGPLSTIVTAVAWASVWLHEILDVQQV